MECAGPSRRFLPRHTGTVLACGYDSDASFVLSVTTDPEQEWRLESSVDLITWTPVTELLLKGSTELVEPPPLPGARFYRVTAGIEEDGGRYKHGAPNGAGTAARRVLEG